ncbi:hypothetical protein [Verrucomicrobium sp. GAS474]|uniref:hypothetical protein n=1 Tax=Verrucomicrobium sp. GAS474 TaxID=1882831 RepID=UPI00138FC606|nr:hypothetical protein [Verrucomicrobium sp. GAS474]
MKKAIAAHKVMTLLGGAHGAKQDYGIVGFQEKAHGQFLIFPKSLKSFEGMRVVGIKYSLFQEAEPEPPKATKKSGKKKSFSKKTVENEEGQQDGVHDKIIPFPREEETEDDEVEELKGYAHKALHALEKGNPVAAYKLLQKIIEA